MLKAGDAAVIGSSPARVVAIRPVSAARRSVGFRRPLVAGLSLVSDMLSLVAGYLIVGMWFDTPGGWAYAGLPLCAAVFAAYGLYGHRKVASASMEAKRLVQAVTTVVIAVPFVLVPGLPRIWMGAMWVLAVLFAGTSRLVLRRTVRTIEATGVVVVGTSDSARAIARALQRGRWGGYRAIGFVDSARNAVGMLDGLPILGSIDNLAHVIRHAGAQAVIVATGALPPSALGRVHRVLERLDIEVFATPAPSSVAPWRVEVEALDGQALIAMRTGDRAGAQSRAKRALDVVGTAVLLALFLPLVLLIAVAIKASSRGPVFFRQQRVGEGGRTFVMLKFRTMIRDAEDRLADLRDSNEADGHLFKIRNDPRCTSAGRLLRKWSLDELPQLWNVLRGDMSLVGPRPALPKETELYEGALRGRLAVKPGLTGLWQVNGRQKLGFDDYAHYDLFYADNWSLGLDFTVLARTIPAVLSREGAW